MLLSIIGIGRQIITASILTFNKFFLVSPHSFLTVYSTGMGPPHSLGILSASQTIHEHSVVPYHNYMSIKKQKEHAVTL
jgi:hypothetical protein